MRALLDMFLRVRGDQAAPRLKIRSANAWPASSALSSQSRRGLASKPRHVAGQGEQLGDEQAGDQDGNGRHGYAARRLFGPTRCSARGDPPPINPRARVCRSASTRALANAGRCRTANDSAKPPCSIGRGSPTRGTYIRRTSRSGPVLSSSNSDTSISSRCARIMRPFG
jgi:hypothetical protein